MKRGQISIFVIVGILLIGSIILFFLVYQNREIGVGFEKGFDAESFMERCIRENAENKLEIMLPQGGFLEPSDYIMFEDTKVSYLCKNINFYEPCISQYPVYITELQNEIEQVLREDVEICFANLETELEDRGFSSSGEDFEIEAILKPGILEVFVFRNYIIDGAESYNYEYFSANIKTNFYDLAVIASEIAKQEAKYCYFEYNGFMILYPSFNIYKFTTSDSSEIYTLEYKDSGDKMNIAIRGCAIPAGF